MKYRFFSGTGEASDFTVERSPDGLLITGPDGQRQPLRVEERADGSALVVTPWGNHELRFVRRRAEVWARVAGRRLQARVERVRPSASGQNEPRDAGLVLSPMPGKLLRLMVSLGDSVRAGQPLAVVEAMKMENELLAPTDGHVVELAAQAPAAVEKGALIARIKAP